jgi:hypothetical protein
MADCLFDRRQAGKVGHSLNDLIAQRIFSIGCGYADANDSARLAADPTHGAQQLSFFNSHYDNSCYLPMMGFVSRRGR